VTPARDAPVQELELIVTPEARGSRLDQFVQRTVSHHAAAATTRGEVQRWIGLGAVRVNGGVRKASELLRAGDVVRVTPPPAARTEATPDPGVAFDVVYEDDAVVVVNKPAGLVVHPARSHPTGTLVNGLLARGYFDAAAIADLEGEAGIAHLRPGIVHRIDKGTSGLLVVARSASAREALKKQLAAHTVRREYDAIAVGDVKLTEHDTPYGRHPTDRLRFSARVRDGKRAVTRVEIVARFGIATLVRCTLRTGRTHQIRVHLAESGTPILGDPLYGALPRDATLAALARRLGHQALHARLLGFVHPTTGRDVCFEAPLPPDFAEALSRLGRA
jgi:23S rRNA pseudouridine1911/1915/1917 synthase